MGVVLLVLTYVIGVAVFAIGLYLIGRREFPAWMRGAWLWPLDRVTPRIIRLQGWAGLAIGASIVAMGVGAMLQNTAGGAFVMFGIVCYLAGVVLFAYSTYLSRRIVR